jgi:hypothetical protein
MSVRRRIGVRSTVRFGKGMDLASTRRLLGHMEVHMKYPFLKPSVNQLIILIALVALNVAGALATARHYPRPMFRRGLASCGSYIATFFNDDGSVTACWALDGPWGRMTDPHVIAPPRPSLLRIWTPVSCSVTFTLLTLLATTGLMRLPSSTAEGTLASSTSPG